MAYEIKRKEDDTAKGDPGAGLLMLLLLLPIEAMQGWVLTKLWAWFIVPTFGAQPLKLVPAIGILIIALFIAGKGNSDKEPVTWEYLGEKVLKCVFWTAITLGIAAFWHQFM